MASEVDVCNLALAHLGDTATVASLDPPEGSAQAEHCARFFPIARDSLLEMHPWKFATRRVLLAQLATETWNWGFAYAEPAGVIKLLAVLPPSAASDAETKEYEAETDGNGMPIILTNQENASLRYIAHVTDTTVFSPLFAMALSWHLASMLAGPLLKGEAGAAEAKRCTAVMSGYLAQATLSDSSQRRIKPEQNVGWINNR